MNITGNKPTSGRPQIDVIVRTILSKTRERAILRAIDSIHACVVARPIVLVDGDRYDEHLLDTLRQRDEVVLHFQPKSTPGRGRAIAAGRQLVSAPYYMYLDDDDELLATGMTQLAEHAAGDRDWDVLITNGYFSANGKNTPMYLDLGAHAAHPLRSLMSECWLFPGASVFRTETISAEFLDTDRDHHEWTYIAFLLAIDKKRIGFLDVPTIVYNDTPVSASKLFKHEEEQISLLEEMKADARVDALTRTIIERKYRNTLHVLAHHYWQRGARGKAWDYHLRSMRPPFTFKYLLFSRKLLMPFKDRGGPAPNA